MVRVRIEHRPRINPAVESALAAVTDFGNRFGDALTLHASVARVDKFVNYLIKDRFLY